MKVSRIVASLGLVASVVSAPAFAANITLPGVANESCSQTCSRSGLRAVTHGSFTADGSNRPFLVCGGLSQTDVRPGFQIAGFDNNSCNIAFGQSAVRAFFYNCLCTND
ncbi:hypothetical protein ATI61_116168 [Archangium gephyra]|uniref:Uncharacterized protein n=1 Tax=Archangium gephyra TaxID=48 RepID=A0AAC8QA43_9BACT|nr:hypothetical protein [Archangium gephyra]AKJ03922.1 Hypothetical protein AA314_05548 [Archangium gephyra]REG23696.1 hypothetical protein ATI61_116168 [Archangium gephyra]